MKAGEIGNHDLGARAEGDREAEQIATARLQDVARLRRLRRQIGGVVAAEPDLQRHPLDHLDAVRLEHPHLGGVVGQQPHLREAELLQQRRADAEVALVILETKAVVRLDGVETLVLQVIGAHLVRQADAAALLVEVEQDPRPLMPHLRQRGVKLWPAVAFQRAEDVAGETGRMQPRQHRLGAVGGTDLDGVMLLAAIVGAEDVEPALFGGAHRHAGGRDRGEHRGGRDLAQHLGGVERGQPLGRGIRERGKQCRGQQLRGFRQRDRSAGKGGVALAAACQRPLHRHAQVVGRIGDRPQPGKIGVLRHHDPGEVAIIDAGLQRLGAPGGDREGERAEGGERRQPLGAQRLDGDGKLPRQHHGQPHAQIGAGTVQAFGGRRAKGEGRHHGSRDSDA
ncbi:hypothetical protein SDC9_06351 [bioreactor metagenome]|uniref:Uncharacterized protein n=1 Tax=bioreactor metagenome TaxID=1076179 RepID=A0A644T1Z3_9ZZZZ